MTKTLKIYYLDDNYINYLRQFDSKGAYNEIKQDPMLVLFILLMAIIILLHFLVLSLNIY